MLLALEKQNLLPEGKTALDVFIVVSNTINLPLAFKIISLLRSNGLACDMDFLERSMKAQMKQANRLQARNVVIFGEDEVARGAVVLRNMAIVVLMFVVYMRKKILEEPLPIQIGIALFVGGALGNLIDRMKTGLVVDFFDFRIWPVFNIADIAICLGVGVMIWSIIREELKSRN